MPVARSCGIILHITSLPSPYGIGDLGPAAYRFADFLAAAGVRYWQILPLNYTEEGSGFSPYSGLSAFAGNTLLISPEALVEDGLLEKKEIALRKPFDEAAVDYPRVVKYKQPLFDLAYRRFRNDTRPDADQPAAAGRAALAEAFRTFVAANRAWLDDYALYMALKVHFGGKSWNEWPDELRTRQPEALQQLRLELREAVEQQQFLQFLFFRQWDRLKAYCAEKHIEFIGDLPFYVGYDSADVWSQPQYFKLDDALKPRVVAGVPPDYFSETGQLWGMPIFDWQTLQTTGYRWWLDRIKQNMRMFGLLRLDHFRAFSAYWEVPATETTAVAGSWITGPGAAFFAQLKKQYPGLPFIAEDLGEIDQPVRDLMTKFSLPGMRVLQFAFGEDMADSLYIPHRHVPHAVVYTGTHDNNTVAGWFEEMDKAGRKRLSAYLGHKVRRKEAPETMIRLALGSVAGLAVFPLQDLFGLGAEAIMNKPSTTSGNWSWRCSEKLLTDKAAKRLRKWLGLYGRLVSPPPPKPEKNPKPNRRKQTQAA